MKKIIATVMIVVGGMMLSACTQMPTEKQSISDIRPQVSFRIADERARNARVIVNGLDMGPVANYIEGTAALRLLSGSHILALVSEGNVIFEEKFYSGDGVNRTFIVK